MVLRLPPDQAGDALCVKHLNEEVLKLTEIPVEFQKLIFKGELTYNTKLRKNMSHVMRKPVFAICEQQRHRSACASAVSLLFAAWIV